LFTKVSTFYAFHQNSIKKTEIYINDLQKKTNYDVSNKIE